MMVYKVEIDRNKCGACGACYNCDPTHFEADRGNKSAIVEGNGDVISVGRFEDDLMEDAKTTMKSCPASAIQVTEYSD